MSEPRPPFDDTARLVPSDGADTRRINMDEIASNPVDPSSPPSPFPNVVRARDGSTWIRQPDGSYAGVPTPPQPPAWVQPVATTVRKSPFAGTGFLAILATLATVAIIAVTVSRTSGGDNTGEVPPVLTTMPEPDTSTPLIDTGAARANQIVTDIVKGCLSSNANMELTFEAAPGVDLAQIYEINPGRPDPLFDIETIQASNLYTVTITSLGPNNLGSKGRWAVDIASGGVVPLRPITGSKWGWDMYTVLMGRGCTTVENML